MKTKYIFLAILLVFAGAGYLYTIAPTASFWDCGEFIAVSYALCVPHPPGTPFFEMFGRCWVMLWKVISMILPISKEVAWQMNLTAVVSSLFSLALVYLMTLKLLQRWRRDDSSLIPFVGAFAAGLALAFSYTFWENSLETEMYSPSTAVILLITWLALRWHEDYERHINRNYFILFIFYLVFLTSGIHLAAFLAVIPLFIYIFTVDRRLLKDLNLWLLGIFVVVSFFSLFITSDQMFRPSMILLFIILIGSVVIAFGYTARYSNSTFFWSGVLIVMAGISAEGYLVVRGSVLTKQYKTQVAYAPRINQCDPADFWSYFEGKGSFYDVLHRKQYPPMKVLPRQTQLENSMNAVQGYFEQIKTYLRYFSWQFVSEESFKNLRVLRFVLLLIFYFIGLWGILEHFKYDKKTFILVFLLFFMTSIAMLSYLNLKFSPSDPNPQHQPREVRERDYFFHPGFAYFTIFLGIGFVAFLDWLRRYFKNINQAQYVGIFLIVALSIVPFGSHFSHKNRYGNWVPRDFGYNMLTCCDDNSLVFTNGDNDTFPLWFVQEVLDHKRSVIVANLSLLNTNWYIKQLKYWGAPITFPDEFINTCDTWPYRTPDGRVMLVKDIMIRHMLANNVGLEMQQADFLSTPNEFAHKYVQGRKGKMAIYFASTVEYSNFDGLNPYMRLEGLVYRITADSLPLVQGLIPTDIRKTEDLLYNKMRYTGIFDPKDFPFLSRIIPDFEKRQKEGEFIDYRVYKDDNTLRTLSNIPASLFALGYEYQRNGKLDEAKKAWQWALAYNPPDSYVFLANLGTIYLLSEDYDSCLFYLRKIEEQRVKDANTFFRMAACYQAKGNLIRAEEYLRKAISAQPRFRGAYEALVGLYLNNNKINEAIGILKEWLNLAPGDSSAERMLAELTSRKQK